MFRGSVDAVSRTGAAGWAACSETPDDIVDVSVFLDGRKLMQVECGRARPDLVKLGLFGEGRHGFRCEFPQALAGNRDYRVSFRIAKTGKLLNNGDVTVRPDGSIDTHSHRGQGLAGEPEWLPLPHSLRGLFEMLALCGDATAIYDMLSRLDLEGAAPDRARALIDVSFGVPLTRRHTPKYSARDHLNDVLLSDRFQRELMGNFLTAFPEKRRLFFIHVPKCAGTDLSAHLTLLFPFIHQKVTEPDWAGKDELFASISRLARNIKFYEEILLTGHNSLRFYSQRNLIRRFDRVFTVLRDPIEIAESQTNYIMTRLMTDARSGQQRADTRNWLKLLGRETISPDLTRRDIQKLCGTILKSPEIARPNAMCLWLGGKTADEAMECLAEHNVEVSFTEHYAAWIKQEWGVSTQTRLNRSEKFVSDATMRRALPHIHKCYEEDIKLYGLLQRNMRRRGGISVKGRELIA